MGIPIISTNCCFNTSNGLCKATGNDKSSSDSCLPLLLLPLSNTLTVIVQPLPAIFFLSN